VLHIIDVIGMALFIGIYAYALSTEPLPGGRDGLRPGLGLRRRQAGWASPFSGRA